MKRLTPILLALFVGSGVAMALSSCVVHGGRISGSAAIHYGPFSFWFSDLPWLDGRPWWRDGIYVQPPPIIFGGPGRGPSIPYQPRPGPRVRPGR